MFPIKYRAINIEYIFINILIYNVKPFNGYGL
jgi:hypothetical protein